MREPRAEALPPALRECAQSIARRVASRGARAWIVGGPVRDLVLGEVPEDLDMASALLPADVERLFERTNAVGKAFGTVLVHEHGLDVQLTTFRRERGYSDARRPDLVEYTSELEEDARRRDFTCNALYLDPLNDELRDPAGGVADIGAHLLRAVGDARARFAEDGLRLVRCARFAAGLDFEVDRATEQGARDSSAALVGVSPERRLGELARIFDGPRPTRALRWLSDTGLLDVLLPSYGAVAPDAADRERRFAALAVLERDADGVGSALGLAVLLEARGGAAEAAARSVLDYLRPSRALRERTEALGRLARELSRWEAPARSRIVRLARDGAALEALRLATARARAGDGDPRAVAQWEAALAPLSAAELRPPPLVAPEDLARAGVARGPAWKTLLEELESLQLDGRLASREQALAWLAERARELGASARREPPP